MFFLKNKKIEVFKKRGFTLVELMVSIGLFTIVVTIAMGSIATIVDTNRKSQTLTLVMNNMGFALESMTRTIKTSTEISGTAMQPIFKNQDGDYIIYKHEGDTIKKCVSTSSGGCNGTFISIISTQVKIENFELELLNGNQPRVLMTIGGYAEIGNKIRSDFNIQTTVSPRELQL